MTAIYITLIVAALLIFTVPRAVFSIIAAVIGLMLLTSAWGAGLNAGFIGILGALIATSFICGITFTIIGAIWASKS